MAWWRPWGAVGAFRNWGDWMLWQAGIFNGDLAELTGFIDEEGSAILSKSFLFNTGSVIGLGFIGGAFISACLGSQFALRFPPVREYVKAVIAGILMGIGSALAGGCNVGGMYNAIGNLAALQGNGAHQLGRRRQFHHRGALRPPVGARSGGSGLPGMGRPLVRQLRR
jgi:hypothetical protein